MPQAISYKPGVQPSVSSAYYDEMWDTFVSAGGYSVTPDYAAGEESVTATTQVQCTVTFLWCFAWYHYDSAWNYIGEEYLEVPDSKLSTVGTKRRPRARENSLPLATASGRPGLDLVNGANMGGHFLPECGGVVSSHHNELYVDPATPGSAKPVGGCYNNFLGQDLDQDAKVWYLPAPDVLVQSGLAPLEFRRVWHDGESNGSAGLPKGWFHNWDVQLTVASRAKSAKLSLPGGRWLEWEVGIPRYGAVLLPVGITGAFDLRWLDAPGVGTVWEFRQPPGSTSATALVLHRVRTNDGLFRRLLWEVVARRPRLSAVSDSGGAKLVLKYKGDELEAVYSPDREAKEVHRADYSINAGLLESVGSTAKMQGGKKQRQAWTYGYDDNRLVKVVDTHGRKHGNSAGNTVTMTIDWTNPLPTVTPAATGSTLVKTYRRNPTNRIEQIITGTP